AADATPALAAALFDWPAGTRVGPESSLVTWDLARPLDVGRTPFSTSTPWEGDPAILAYLLGEDRRRALGVRSVVSDVSAMPALFPSVADEVARFVTAMHGS